MYYVDIAGRSSARVYKANISKPVGENGDFQPMRKYLANCK